MCSRFPINRPEILEKWLLAIKRKNFIPKAHHCLCSEHFTEDDYLGDRKMLKQHSVPSKSISRLLSNKTKKKEKI